MYKHWTVSNKGGRATNQDFSTVIDQSPFFLLAVVCDGMGGNEGGGVASGLAVKTIQKLFEQATEGTNFRQLLYKSMVTANEQIWQTGRQYPNLSHMGTTVVALLLLPDGKAVVMHAGDSRCYQIRQGRLLFRTDDHSRVFELLKKGILKNEEEARLSDEANVITRALGIKPTIDIEQHSFSYQEGDRFMLSSDGIHGIIPEKELLDLLQKGKDFQESAEKLAQTAQQLGIQQGGNHDNLTAIVIDCGTVSATKTLFDKTKIKKALPLLLSLFLLVALAAGAWHIRKQWQGKTTKAQLTDTTKTASEPTKEQEEERESIFKLAGKAYELSYAVIDTAYLITIDAENTWKNVPKKMKQDVNAIADSARNIEKSNQITLARKKATQAQNKTQKYDSTTLNEAKKLANEATNIITALQKKNVELARELNVIKEKNLDLKKRRELEAQRKKAEQKREAQREKEKQNKAQELKEAQRKIAAEQQSKKAEEEANKRKRDSLNAAGVDKPIKPKSTSVTVPLNTKVIEKPQTKTLTPPPTTTQNKHQAPSSDATSGKNGEKGTGTTKRPPK